MKKILLILLLSLGSIIPSYADYDSCVNAYENKDYQKAFIECQASASEGDAKSQNMLGYFYQYGYGVSKNYNLAFDLYTKSTEQGDAGGQSGLSSIYGNGHGVTEDYKQSFDLALKAAEQGNARGQNIIGSIYEYGLGVEIDHQKAFDFYTKALDQDNTLSHVNLALMYFNGKLVSQNYLIAYELLKKVENRPGGGENAQYILGYMYQYGLGIKKDKKESLNWYTKSAEQGNAAAQNNIGSAYFNGNGVTKDYKQSVIWYKKSAEQGNASAQNNIGNAYFNGNGVTKDYKQSVIWYTKAAEQGIALSQNNLGNAFYNGNGVEKDYKQAFNWYTKAAEQGEDSAQSNLGILYQYGYGVSKDYMKALDFYKKAADQGSNFAKEKQEALALLIKEEAEAEAKRKAEEAEAKRKAEEAEAKRKAEEAAKEEILQAINSIEIAPGISTNLIGKWYGSEYESESETCYGSVTEELIVLHDQVMSRYSTEYSILDDSYSSKYFNLASNNIHFFPNNIIYFSDYDSSEIFDLYFEKPMFPELYSNAGYKKTKLYKCSNLNNEIDFILLESDAIEFDKLMHSAKTKCQNSKPIDCLREFIKFADVSKNNKLSRAEITRFSKFIVKWLTLKGELNIGERMGSSAATIIIAPALAEFILLNYDYDNDEHIDIKEMTFDIVNISGGSGLNNKIIRGYIEALDLISESKINASRMIDDLF